MLTIIKVYIQYIAISCFVSLTVIGWVEKDLNFGFMLNAGLVILYIALYIQPFK